MTTINVTLIYSLNINGRIVSTNEKESNEKTGFFSFLEESKFFYR